MLLSMGYWMNKTFYPNRRLVTPGGPQPFCFSDLDSKFTNWRAELCASSGLGEDLISLVEAYAPCTRASDNCLPSFKSWRVSCRQSLTCIDLAAVWYAWPLTHVSKRQAVPSSPSRFRVWIYSDDVWQAWSAEASNLLESRVSYLPVDLGSASKT